MKCNLFYPSQIQERLLHSSYYFMRQLSKLFTSDTEIAVYFFILSTGIYV